MSVILFVMALFIKQDEEKSELQTRLATELQERAKERARLVERPDGVDDSQFIKGTKETSNLAWVWILVIVVLAVFIFYLMIPKS
ncbi:MAG: hypothetical protein PWQ10_546 [Patescibacteria group bacterium]|nr:hypothetical protein [Patescibacteria group bacterium]